MRAVAGPGFSLAERVAGAEDALAEAGAEVLVRPEGRVVRQRDFPHVYDANVVRRVRLRPETLDEALVALAQPFADIGARHLQLISDVGDFSAEIASALRYAGFAPDRLLVMVLRAAARGARNPAVRVRRVPDEASWEAFAYAMDRLNREESWYAPSVSREIIGSMIKKSDAGAQQLYVAEEGGRVVGSVGLSLSADARGLVASVLSVGTLAHARRRGVATTMVLEMVARAASAGADFVYLLTRAEDTPQEIYRRIGFARELEFDVWLRLP